MSDYGHLILLQGENAMKRLLSIITIIGLILSMGSSSFALDKVKEADKLYKQAIKIEKSKPKDAIKLLTKAITYNPKNPEYYFKRGFLETDMGKVIKDYEIAVVLNPDKYYPMCFDGYMEGNKYIHNMTGFQLTAKSWTIEDTTTLADIKKYLASYKGDRVKNAHTILDKATEGSYKVLEATSSKKDAFALVQLISDPKNEIPDNESFAAIMADVFSEDPTVSDLQPVQSGKLGNVDCAYVDYKQTDSGVTLLCRNYSIVFDYYTLNITVFAADESAFETAMKEFFNTFKFQ